MRGLKTPESIKFQRFHALVQGEAKKQGCVWFAFAGEGNDLETEELEIADLTGWLVPETLADEFEAFWLTHEGLPEYEIWNDYFTWAIWSMEDGVLHIEFET